MQVTLDKRVEKQIFHVTQFEVILEFLPSSFAWAIYASRMKWRLINIVKLFMCRESSSAALKINPKQNKSNS